MVLTARQDPRAWGSCGLRRNQDAAKLEAPGLQKVLSREECGVEWMVIGRGHEVGSLLPSSGSQAEARRGRGVGWEGGLSGGDSSQCLSVTPRRRGREEVWQQLRPSREDRGWDGQGYGLSEPSSL